ncbi:MAG: CRISPR-associated protein Cas5 [Desulfurococcaceae archaeon]
MPILRSFYTRLTLTWGFSIRHKGTSAAQPAYILPPSTTVVGAFLYPLLRAMDQLGIRIFEGREDYYGKHRLITPIIKYFLEETKVASASLTSREDSLKNTGLTTHQEFGRLVTAPYRSGGGWESARKTILFSEEFYRKGITQAIAVQGIGVTYGPGALIELIWVFDAENICNKLKIKPGEFDKIAEKTVHGVIRVGSKESLVAVDYEKTLYDKNVVVLKPGERFKTRFYVEKRCVDPIDRHLVSEITLPGLNGEPVVYYISARIASNTLIVPQPAGYEPHYTLLESCKAYKLSNNVIGVGR